MARIIIVPVGEISPHIIQAVQARIESVLGVKVHRGPSRSIPFWAFDPRRRQFHAKLFIPLLSQVIPPGPSKILGITAVDLGAPRLHFVFGVADPLMRVAVISLCRLDQQFYGRPADPALLEHRAGVEALHELGHLFGLPHCSKPACVMFFANCIDDVDPKADTFCPRCQQLLKMQLF